ncbi:uncharacterized protein V1518DRAFT_410291 [Limtongia smithiae]|uniref:uncharacterized protein n=1 Tax=Limtongia smithiae TaxID=1125753 RepID=UPI0034CE4311
MSDPYTLLAGYLESARSESLDIRVLQRYVSAVRSAGPPSPGSLARIWPGVVICLSIPTLSSDIIALLVDDVISPLISAPGATSWQEIKTVVGDAEALLTTVMTETHDKIRQTAVEFLSLYDFSAGGNGEQVIRNVVGLVQNEKLSEGIISRVETAVARFLVSGAPFARSVVITNALEIKRETPETATTTMARVQELVLLILRQKSNSTGVDDIPPELVVFAVASDDMLAELVTMQFYEALLQLYLPPSIFMVAKPAYVEIARIYSSSFASSISRGAAGRTLGRLGQLRGDVFALIDAEFSIVKNLTLRDEVDRTLLALIPGDYVALHNPAIVRNYPISSASLVEVLCNWVHSSDARSLLALDSQHLLRLPVPELLRVCKELATTSDGALVLVSMPAVMDVILTKKDSFGYQIARLRGDVIDALQEIREDVIGPYWAGRIREAKLEGPWGHAGSNEARVDVMDRAA